MASRIAVLSLFLVHLVPCGTGNRHRNTVDRVFRTLSGPLIQTTEFTTVCMEELGCFPTGPPYFDPEFRNVSLPPLPRDVIATRLELRRRDAEPVTLRVGSRKNYPSLSEAPFNPRGPFRFIIHGFMDSLERTTWAKELTAALLKVEDSNVILVDWSNGNIIPYTQAVANARVVGAELTVFIQEIRNTVNSSAEFHLIGHSLGAQVAAYAGAAVPGLQRITGLDPAFPGFDGMDPLVRLDPTDAKFVDVIHTDCGESVYDGYGTLNRLGHLDFFPNGGNNQPGCEHNIANAIRDYGVAQGIMKSIMCEHLRAAFLFMDSVLPVNGVIPQGIPCSSGWSDFLEGRCTECGDMSCPIMGFYADRSYKEKEPLKANLYLQTTAEKPYWLFHCLVNLTVGGEPGDGSLTLDELQVTVLENSQAYKLHTIVRNVSLSLDDSQWMSFLATSKEPLPRTPESVEIRWNLIEENNIRGPIILRTVTIVPFEIVKLSGERVPATSHCFYFNTLLSSNDSATSVDPC